MIEWDSGYGETREPVMYTRLVNGRRGPILNPRDVDAGEEKTITSNRFLGRRYEWWVLDSFFLVFFVAEILFRLLCMPRALY